MNKLIGAAMALLLLAACSKTPIENAYEYCMEMAGRPKHEECLAIAKEACTRGTCELIEDKR